MSCCSSTIACVRFLHNIPDGASVSIKIDGNEFVAKLDYQDVTEYLELPAGHHDLEILTYDSNQSLFKTCFDSLPKSYKTIAFIGKQIELLVSDDNLSTPRPGLVKINLIHSAYGSPLVDIYVNKKILFAKVEYKQIASTTLKLNGTLIQNIQAKFSNSDSSVIDLNLPLSSGGIYTIFTSGNVNLGLVPIIIYDNHAMNIDVIQKDLNPQAYMGTWYQIADIRQAYESMCSRSKAIYTLTPDGVKIFNTCYDENGNIVSTITGQGELLKNNAIAVSFPGFPAMGPNYIIHSTDYKNYAIVGSYTRSSLYILSRKPQMQRHEYNHWLQYANSLGYDEFLIKSDLNTILDKVI